MTRPLTQADHMRIADAIRAAESTTSGEIHCVVARSSDDYFYHAAFFTMTAGLILSAATAVLLDGWWVTLRLPAFMAAVLLALGCALALIWLAPELRAHVVPKGIGFRRAHENALRQFAARNVHLTAARTGVLIFVSLAERYAVVIADSGIDAKAPQAVWDGIVSELTAQARNDRLAEGFVTAIGAAGALLAHHFPIGAGDRNELPDHLVEI